MGLVGSGGFSSAQAVDALAQPDASAAGVAETRTTTPGKGSRVRARGVVTLSLADRFVLQQGLDATIVETALAESFQPGEEVEAVGFKSQGEHLPILRQATVKQTGKRLDIPSQALNPAELVTGAHNMQLVTVEGRLIDVTADKGRVTLALLSGGTFWTAVLHSNALGMLRNLDKGSDLRITGVCSIQRNQDDDQQAFHILLRSTSDVTVLRPASWWSTGRLLSLLLCCSLLGTTVIIGWVIVLRRRVAEQIDVIRRQLVEADRLKDKAEGASRAKSDFLANMSHEIRTPLNGIIGMTELAMAASGSEQREYHNLIKSSGEALLVILNDILDYSKIEAEKITLEAVDFSLEEVISSSIKGIAPSAHKKGLELTFYLEPDVPLHIVGDPGRLRQVLLNLTGNALKFTSKGEVGVRVSRDQVKGNGVQLHFAIHDTGVGIPKDKQLRLFKPFEQADSSTTRRYGGTGLGLSISAKIVQLMGGTIWIESAPGRGSTFHFTSQFLKSASPTPLVRAASRSFSHESILVIDDNATSRKILADIMSTWQVETVLAESGSSGLMVLEQAARSGKPFRLVLLDDGMDGMSGSEFIQQMKKGAASGTPVITMLSSGSANNRSDDGVTNCLIKPVGFAELRAAIERELFGISTEQEALKKCSAFKPAEVALRLLVAEDNPVNQRLASAMFGKMGHQVTIANNGLEALSHWNKSEFDLIFMDVQMPEMDGLEAARQIRKQELLKGTRSRMIAMTANVLDGDRELCLAAGMDDYVSKPISRDSLADVIQRVLVAPR
jgi:signal transduction histidine kinase/CheY-like chemotaxis protein